MEIVVQAVIYRTAAPSPSCDEVQMTFCQETAALAISDTQWRRLI